MTSSPATMLCQWAAMQPLDQYILAQTAELDAVVREAYDDFEFHRAYQALNEFTNADLSALYLDVVKDRLYTLAPKVRRGEVHRQRMWRIAEAMTRLDCADPVIYRGRSMAVFLPKVPGRKRVCICRCSRSGRHRSGRRCGGRGGLGEIADACALR